MEVQLDPLHKRQALHHGAPALPDANAGSWRADRALTGVPYWEGISEGRMASGEVAACKTGHQGEKLCHRCTS